jgi:phytanoyl-CoA hydroxylase
MTMLSQEQVSFFQENGYLLVSGIFSVKQLDELEVAFDGIIARRLARREGLDATWGGDAWRAKYGATETVVLHTHDVQAYDAAWTRALVHDPLTEAMSQVIGCPNVQLHHTKLFQKPAEKGSPFPMHQDIPYFPHEKHTMTAAVVHLSDATTDMGCIAVYPGSHKLGQLETWEHNHLDPAKYPLSKATLCPAKRGDVLFFNYKTIHGSGINSSSKTRKTVLIQFRDPTDRPTTEVHRSHAQGLMLRGIDPLSEVVLPKSAEGALARH